MGGSRAVVVGVVVLSLLGGSPDAPANPQAAASAERAFVRTWKIHYRTHNGLRRTAYVAVPRSYRPRRSPPLPLVISPHGRGVPAAANLRTWGHLPALGPFAVVAPSGHGRHLGLFSWGYRGQIADLARMPRIVTRALPWLRIDRRRVYAVGASMGAQEALLLLARRPRLLAGVIAFDPVADLARRYADFPRLRCYRQCRRDWKAPIGVGLRHLVRREVGGTPASNTWGYAIRSPLTYARAIARSGVPLQLWWSRTDRTVTSGERQGGLLASRLRSFNPNAAVEEVVGWWRHTAALRTWWGLPQALARFCLLSPSFARQPAGIEVIPPARWPSPCALREAGLDAVRRG